jgi:Holliday junction DNA helicase RuvA
MIARISGTLQELTDAAALVDTGTGLWYEVLVPACEAEPLTRRLGQDVVLHTTHYMEGDPSHGQQTPRLIGFTVEADREFFRVFTTVKGLGIRKALKALQRRPSEVVGAIVAKDAKLLKGLPGIGARMAERIITELTGKLDAFAAEAPSSAAGPATPDELPESATEAMAVLVQLGERRPDAADLVQRVLAVAPDATAEEIIQQAYRLKAVH